MTNESETATWQVRFAEYGGYDCMSDAWEIDVVLSSGNTTTLTIDRADFGNDEECKALAEQIAADHNQARRVPGLESEIACATEELESAWMALLQLPAPPYEAIERLTERRLLRWLKTHPDLVQSEVARAALIDAEATDVSS